MGTNEYADRLARARDAERTGAYDLAEQECRAALDATQDPEQTVDALTVLGLVHMRCGRFDDALETLERARVIAQREAYDRGLAQALYAIGSTLRVRGDLPGAITTLEQAREFAARIQGEDVMVRILSGLGAAYAQSNDLANAMVHMKEAAEVALRLEDHAAYATIIGNIGNVYSELSDFEDALEYYHRALAEHERLGMIPDIARDLMNIGVVSLEIDDLDSALEHFNKALAAMESSGTVIPMAETLVGLGSTHMELNDKNAALNALRRAYDIYVRAGAELTAAHVEANIGIVLRELGDLQGALTCFHHALAVLEEANQLNDLADVYQSLGVLYNTDGFEAKDVDTAVGYITKAIEINTRIGRKKPLYECHLNLAKIYRSIGDQDRYIEHFTLYHDLQREVQNGNAQRASIQHQRQREVERHEREVNELRLEQQLAHAKAEIFRLETVEIARQRDLLEHAYERLRSAFRETTMLRIDNKARFLVMSVTVLLFLFSDSVIDPTIYTLTAQFHTSQVLTYGVKIIAVLLLKPLEDLTATMISKRQREQIERDVESIRAGV